MTYIISYFYIFLFVSFFELDLIHSFIYFFISFFISRAFCDMLLIIFLEIRVSFEIDSMVPPQPCKTFEDFHFDSLLNQSIVTAEYKVHFLSSLIPFLLIIL